MKTALIVGIARPRPRIRPPIPARRLERDRHRARRRVARRAARARRAGPCARHHAAEQIAALGWKLDGERLDAAVLVSGCTGRAPRGRDRHRRGFRRGDAYERARADAVAADRAAARRGRARRAGRRAEPDGQHRRGDRHDRLAVPREQGRTERRAAHRVAADAPRRVHFAHPGWVRTDMGGAQAAIDPETSVAGMRRVIAESGADVAGKRPFLPVRRYRAELVSW